MENPTARTTKPDTEGATVRIGDESTAVDSEGATLSLAPAPAPAPAGAAEKPAKDVTAESMTVGAMRPGLGLATRYFLMTAALIGVAIGGAVAVTAYRANVVADRTVREALANVGTVFQSFLAERDARLRGTIRTLADEPQTRALLAESVSPETIMDWAQDKTKAVGATYMVVLDPEGHIMARSDKPIDELSGLDLSGARFVQAAMSGKDASALGREGGRVYSVAASPVESGEGTDARLEGIVFAGYPFDNDAARAVAAVSGGDATFLSSIPEKEGPPKMEVIASTLGALTEPFLSELVGSPGAIESLLGKGEEKVGPLDLFPKGDHTIAVGFPLRTGSGDVIGAFVSSRSLREAKAAFTQIQRTLLLVGLLSLIVAVPASYVFGRRIARPLVELAKSAHAVREGDLNVQIGTGGTDEVGLLARSFAQMVAELKEKAELENFVAGLGVSAHDITQGLVTAAQTVGVGDLTQGRRAAGTEVKLEPGAILGGRYKIESLLGQGGMGAVWKANDRELSEDVALKVIRAEMMQETPGMVDQLKDEIRLARRITHPNILRTHDFGDLDGVRFISMEYVPGPTLRTVLDKRGPVSLAAGLQIGRQICRGLAAAHEQGIVHRDIKPQNIIIAPNSVVKLMDFGIACSQEKHQGIQGDAMVVGTPDYMAPEQIEGKPVDERTDIYSIGIVLYEMFTCIRPFHATTTVQTLMRNMSENPTPLRQVRADMPEALETLIAQATAKKPEDRIQTAAALRKALGRISS